MNRSISVESVADLPTEEHWAILTSTRLNIPGDERSRTLPGHGYPARTEEYVTYEAFLDRDDFLEELRRRCQTDMTRVKGIHIKDIFKGRNVVVVE